MVDKFPIFFLRYCIENYLTKKKNVEKAQEVDLRFDLRICTKLLKKLICVKYISLMV